MLRRRPEQVVNWKKSVSTSDGTDSNSVSYILCKENTLELDDEKVDQLLNILQ